MFYLLFEVEGFILIIMLICVDYQNPKIRVDNLGISFPSNSRSWRLWGPLFDHPRPRYCCHWDYSYSYLFHQSSSSSHSSTLRIVCWA